MTTRRRRALVAAAAALFFVAFVLRTAWGIGGRVVFVLADDAMISMTYARNLVAGHGLRWTVTGPPVEGYTNFGWTMWMALVHLFPVGDRFTSLVVMLLGAAILVANLWIVARIADRLGDDGRDLGTAAMVLTAFGFGLVFWTLRGMEVGFLALLVDGAVLLALDVARAPTLGRVAAIGALLSAAVLTRSDALVGAVVVAAWLMASLPRARRWPLALVVPAALAVTVAAHTLFRWRYYGALLPNTYYLKLGGVPLWMRLGRGVDTLSDELLRGPLLVVALAAVGLSLRRRGLGLLAALFFAQCAYSVWVGGDSWEDFAFLNRFVSQAWPSLTLLAAFGLSRLLGARLIAAAALVVLLCDGGAYKDWLKNGARFNQTDALMADYGMQIGAATDDGARIAVAWAGALPYFAHRDGIDLLGKCDPVIAHGPRVGAFYPGHDKWNLQYSIVELRPDVVALVVSHPPVDDRWLAAQGYRSLGNRVFALVGSPHVHLVYRP
jgi:arabinofuranosyltransferase